MRVLSRFKRRNAERWWRGAGVAEEAQRAGQEGGAAPSHDHQYAHNVSPTDRAPMTWPMSTAGLQFFFFSKFLFFYLFELARRFWISPRTRALMMMSQFLLATAILVASATVYVGKEWRSAFASAFGVTILYLRALVFFLRGGTYKACPYFITERNSAGLSTERERLQAKAQTYSLALIFYLWSKPHYRSGTFANDMVKVRSRRVGGERTMKPPHVFLLH